jgi:pilus assembly protein CpaF
VEALDRLSNLALSARANLNHSFMRSETAKAIDFTLYCERAASGRRQVREVVLVKGYDYRSEQFQVEEVYSAPQPKTNRELMLVGASADTPTAQFA